MSDEQEKTTDSANALGLGDLSQIFAPSWARQTPEEVAQRATRFARDDEDDDRDDRRGGRPPRREGRGPRREGDMRPPRRDDRGPRRDGESRGPRRDDRPPRREGDARPPRRDDRGPRRDGEGRRPAPPPPPLDLDIRFMPASKALAAIVRRIQTTHRAYPIREIVKLFQGDDASLAARIETRRDGDQQPQIFQCRACGMPALTEAEVAEHLLRKHLADYFDVEEVEVEAPAGNFPCVARCGLTGELLGPPNHHSYAHRVQEMLSDRFPGMAEEEYRRHIEMVRDPEVVEQWREQCRHRRVYRRKPSPDETAKPEKPADGTPEGEAPAETAPAEKAPALERHEAELIFRREILPGLIGAATHVVCPATALKNLPDRRLAAALNARFAEETDPARRFAVRNAQPGEAAPSRLQRNGSLFAAVHAAFHHRGLHFFRAGDERGQEFVMASQPVPFDLDHATPELREIAQYVATNPSCPPKQLVEALNPGNDAEKTARIVSQVKWLVEKGHLVEFFNGFLSPPATHPVFKPNPPKPKKVRAEGAAEGGPNEAQPSQEEGGPNEAQPSQEGGRDEARPSQEEGGRDEAQPMQEGGPNEAQPTQEEGGPDEAQPSQETQEVPNA